LLEKKNVYSVSARHHSQYISPPISQIILKNFIKISLIIKKCPEEIWIKLAIVLNISKSRWNTGIWLAHLACSCELLSLLCVCSKGDAILFLLLIYIYWQRRRKCQNLSVIHFYFRVAEWVRLLDYLTTHTRLSPIRRGFTPGFVTYKKGCIRFAVASDKAYQLLVHGRWFSVGTTTSSTTKAGRHN
jgi:hypothetical protein